MTEFEDKLTRDFAVAMASARALGWWVEIDYRSDGRTCIYANRFGFLSRTYAELAFSDSTPLEVYRRWFANCASHLERAVGYGEVELLEE